MKHCLLLPLLALALSGCALFPTDDGQTRPGPVTGPSDAQPATEFAPAVGTTALGARAVSAAALDTTTEAEKSAALTAQPAGGERILGKTVVALGPIETAGGKSLTLELRPGSGGALLSLAAFQALGLSLTDLPEVTVFVP
jgi:hypothetical protein